MTDWSDAEDREQAALDAARLHEWAVERHLDARDAEIARLRAEVDRLRALVESTSTPVPSELADPPQATWEVPCDIDRVATAALRETADAWQTGGWTALTTAAKKGGPEGVIGASQAVTEWLRARADQKGARPTQVEGDQA